LSDSQKADALLTYFKSVYNPKTPTSTNFSNLDSNLCDIDFIKEKDTVLKKLLKCKNKNIHGPDGIPGIILRKCAKSLARPLSILFDHIFQNCDIPEVFLISYVTPIPKIPNPTLLSHFRPIAGSSDIFKTLERVIGEKLMDHLKSIQFLPNEQYGGRPGHSTTKQMVIFTEKLINAIANGLTTDVIYIDLQKAYDKMKISELEKELKEAKVGGKLLKLCIYFLSHRKFSVKVNEHHSKTDDCDSGTNQGGALSGIYFIIFFSKLSKLLNEIDLIIHFKFIDDLKLFYSYFINDFDPTPLQNAINTVLNWCESTAMALSSEKTFHVQYGPKNPNAKYSINDTPIETKEVTRDLGLYIKNDLSMSHHIDIITTTANGKKWSILKKVVTKDPKILIQIFNTYIRPTLEYASPVFNINQRNVIDTLEYQQRSFTKTIFNRNNPNINYSEIPSYPERLKLYGMTSLHQRRIIADILLAYDLLIKHPNDQIDITYYENLLSLRSGGHYVTKSNIKLPVKLSKLHFSTRMVSLLNAMKLKLHEFSTSDNLRLHLQTIDFSKFVQFI
jgi:hypothetical protein